MATYTSDKVGSGVPVRRPVSGPTVVVAKFSLTAALAATDVIQMIPVHAGEIVYDLWVITPDLDSGGTALRLQCGDGGDADRYIAAFDAATAAAFTRMSAVTAAVSTSPYTADDTIDLTVSTGPTTGATTGDIYMMALLGQER